MISLSRDEDAELAKISIFTHYSDTDAIASVLLWNSMEWPADH